MKNLLKKTLMLVGAIATIAVTQHALGSSTMVCLPTRAALSGQDNTAIGKGYQFSIPTIDDYHCYIYLNSGLTKAPTTRGTPPANTMISSNSSYQYTFSNPALYQLLQSQHAAGTMTTAQLGAALRPLGITPLPNISNISLLPPAGLTSAPAAATPVVSYGSNTYVPPANTAAKTTSVAPATTARTTAPASR